MVSSTQKDVLFILYTNWAGGKSQACTVCKILEMIIPARQSGDHERTSERHATRWWRGSLLNKYRNASPKAWPLRLTDDSGNVRERYTENSGRRAKRSNTPHNGRIGDNNNRSGCRRVQHRCSLPPGDLNVPPMDDSEISSGFSISGDCQLSHAEMQQFPHSR